MPVEKPKSPKAIEEALEDIKARADKLDKKIQDAEAKHPPKLDHPEGGGTF